MSSFDNQKGADGAYKSRDDDGFAEARTLGRADNYKNDANNTFSPQQLGRMLDTADDFANYQTANRYIAHAAQSVYDRGSEEGLKDFVKAVNEATRTDGVKLLVVERADKTELHLAEDRKRPYSMPNGGGEYFKDGSKWYRDLAKPTEIATRNGSSSEQDRSKIEQVEHDKQVQASANVLMSDRGFHSEGTMSGGTARQFSDLLRGQESNMSQYVQELNQELTRRGANSRISVDVEHDQLGKHGNTVTLYHVKSRSVLTGQTVQGFTDSHDTVRSIAPAPALRWDKV